MPRYRRYFAPGQIVFLTLVCHERVPWLAQNGTRASVLEALRAVREYHPFAHYGHVLLNDHLHLLLRPAPCSQLPLLVGSFKRAAGFRLRNEVHGRLWQKRYFDHVVRDMDDFTRHLDYLHFNPVKHRLVLDAADWPWSSLHAWRERGMYPEGWGTTEPDDLPVVGE